MRFRLAASAVLLAIGSVAYGQAIPAGGTPMSPMTTNTVGPNLPDLDGIFHYALGASEVVQLGYYGPGVVTHSTILSANSAYTSKSITKPFSLLLGGGVILGNQPGQGNTGYTNMSVSQGYLTKNWVFNIADSFSFLPQSPTTGLSGIAGVGDLGSLPVQGPGTGPAGGVFSTAGNRIANSLDGSVERQISHNTSISGSGLWSVLHFLDDNTGGLDSSQVSGTVALNRRLDGRSSVSVDAVYTTFSYTGTGSGVTEPDIETRGINVTYQRVLSRTLSVTASIGPQWVSSANSTFIPSSLGVAATAGLSYQRKSTSGVATYTHGVNAGSGVLPGAIADTISGSLAHSYGRTWVASLNGAYTHTSGLTVLTNGTPAVPVNEVYNTVFGGGQLTRAISTHFSAYVSYTAQNQSNNFAVGAPNALNGTSQTFGIGITFTPRSTRLGQF
jgi:hypothetical protein